MTFVKTIHQKISVGLILFLIAFYLRLNTGFLKLSFLGGANKWLNVCIWIGISLLILYIFPRKSVKGRHRHKHTVYIWAFNTAVAVIVIDIGMGVLGGLGTSPYDHSLMGILQNFILIGSSLVGQEMIRSYILDSFMSKKEKWIIPVMIGFMTCFSITLVQIQNISSVEGLMNFCAMTLLPVLGKNMLATYFASYAGAGASIIFLGGLEAFEWLSPILPDLTWLMKGVLGIGVPTGALIILSQAYAKLTGEFKAHRDKETKVYEWLPVTVISVLTIWFIVGVFPIFPSAIATGSMKPLIDPGDVVLVRKVQEQADIDALQVGDIIQFKRDNVLVNHRIIEIVEEDNQTKYRTKGDNNSGRDADLVEAQDIKGTIVEVIPKIGWPTLILKNSNKEIPEDVEF